MMGVLIMLEKIIKNSKIGVTLQQEYKPISMLLEKRNKLLDDFIEGTKMREQFLSINLEDWYK
jgi:hypothetical protein